MYIYACILIYLFCIVFIYYFVNVFTFVWQVSRTSVVGGALGPDWLSGLELKGKTQRKIIMETEVEVKRILEPTELKDLEVTTHWSPEERKFKTYSTSFCYFIKRCLVPFFLTPYFGIYLFTHP